MLAKQREEVRTAAKLTLTGVITKEYRTQMNPVAARAVSYKVAHTGRARTNHMGTERHRRMRIHQSTVRTESGSLHAPKF